MAITQAICTSFKQEILVGTHNFTTGSGHTFKIALFTNLATLSEATSTYSATNEVAGTNYSAGGNTLTNVTPDKSTSVAYTGFNSPTTWSTSTITARGALIYNLTQSSRAVVVLDFASDKTSTAGDFSIVFPATNASTALIRIA
jgi:hypothetical protein